MIEIRTSGGILNLIEKFNVYNENGTINFKAIRFDFYVGPNYWLLRNNEKVIARLFALLQHGMLESEKEKVTFNVFKPADAHLDYPEGKPFGEANLNEINEKLRIMDY